MGEFQTAFLHPWRTLREGDGIWRDVPNKSKQLNPFTKGPSRSPLAKGTCDGHVTEGIPICDLRLDLAMHFKAKLWVISTY